jgi:protein TonB
MIFLRDCNLPHEVCIMLSKLNKTHMETTNRTPKWHDGYSFRLSIGWVLSLTIVLTAFEWKSDGEQPIPTLNDNCIVEEEMLDMMQVHRELPPSPPKAVVQPESVPVDDDPISETLTDIDTVLDALPKTKTTVVAPVVVPVPEPKIIQNEVFDIVKQQAFPMDGWDKFYR